MKKGRLLFGLVMALALIVTFIPLQGDYHLSSLPSAKTRR